MKGVNRPIPKEKPEVGDPPLYRLDEISLTMGRLQATETALAMLAEVILELKAQAEDFEKELSESGVNLVDGGEA